MRRAPLLLATSLLLALLTRIDGPPRAHAQGSIPLLAATDFGFVNGNKVVVEGNRLHLVYMRSGQIYYATSTNCGTWSAGVMISGTQTSCSSPTIGVDAEGTLGVAFAVSINGLSHLYYASRAVGGAWATPVLVARNSWQPSLVCEGDQVHIAHNKPGEGIYYATFPTLAGPPANWNTNVGGEAVVLTCLCPGAPGLNMPAIAKVPNGSIYVAYVRTNPGFPFPVDLMVGKGPASGGATEWPVDLTVEGSAPQIDNLEVHTSATVAPNGDVYVVESDQAGVVLSRHFRVAALQGNNPWKSASLGSKFTEPDVAVLGNTMRIVYADRTAGTCPSPVIRADYDWSQGATPAPVGSETITTAGRTPQALFYTSDGCGCDLWAMYAACSPARIAPYPGSGAARGPLVYFDFDSPSQYGKDKSGHGHDGTLGGAGIVGGVYQFGNIVIGNALRFQVGNDIDEFSVPHSDELNLLNGVTGSAWIRPRGHHDELDAQCPEGTIFTKAASYWFQVSTDNQKLEFQNEGSGGSIAYGTVPGGIPQNQWTHVAFSRSIETHTVNFYVNGTPLAANPLSLTTNASYNVGPITLGNHSFGGYGHCEFNGDIDEVKIWDYCLSAEQIAAEYRRVHDADDPTDNGATDTGPYPILKKPSEPIYRTASGLDREPMRSAASISTHDAVELHLGRWSPGGRIAIHDVAGRLVRVLEVSTEARVVRWDGRDAQGRRVPSGVYLVRPTADAITDERRIVVLK